MNVWILLIMLILSAGIIALRSWFKIVQAVLFLALFVVFIFYMGDNDFFVEYTPLFTLFLIPWLFGSLIALALNDEERHKILYKEIEKLKDRS